MKKIKNYLLKMYYKILWFYAKKYLNKTKPLIIWINWSVWKTSCRMIITQTLQKYLWNFIKIYTSKENFNWELWLPLSILEIEEISPNLFSFLKVFILSTYKFLFKKPTYKIWVLEYWIDTPGEMKFLLSIIKPDIWVFTKIDSVHSLQFGTPQAIANEESLMIKNTKEIAFLNIDDIYARQLYNLIQIDKFFYTTTKEESSNFVIKPDIDFELKELNLDKDKNLYSLLEIRNNKIKRQVKTNLIWKETYWYIALAYWILDILIYKFWLKSKIIIKNEEEINYKLIPWRSSIFKWINNSIIFDSSYNASPLSMRKLIQTTYTLKNQIYKNHKICLVLWDMRELWDFEEEEHRKIAWVASMAWDMIVLVWKSTNCRTKDELEKIGFNWKIYCFQNSKEAWLFLQNFLNKDSNQRILLFKWSQNTIFLEEAIKYVLNPQTNNMNNFDYLTRQSPKRLKIKSKFFKKLKNNKIWQKISNLMFFLVSLIFLFFSLNVFAKNIEIPKTIKDNCYLIQEKYIDYCPKYRQDLKKINIKLYEIFNLAEKNSSTLSDLNLKINKVFFKLNAMKKDMFVHRKLNSKNMFLIDYMLYLTKLYKQELQNKIDFKWTIKELFQKTYFNQQQSWIVLQNISLFNSNQNPEVYDNELILKFKFRNYTDKNINNVEDIYCFATKDNKDFIFPLHWDWLIFPWNKITNIVWTLQIPANTIMDTPENKTLYCMMVYFDNNHEITTNFKKFTFDVQ